MMGFKNSFKLDKLPERTVYIIYAVLLVLVHGQSVFHEFRVDDYFFLNKRYLPDFQTFLDFFHTTSSQHFSPIYYLVNIGLFNSFPSSPSVLYFFSLLLFLFAGILFFKTCRHLTNNTQTAFLAGLFFLLHPVVVHTVNQITLNFVLIHSIFLLLSFLSFLEAVKNERTSVWKYAASLLFFTAALLTFEGALLFPLLPGITLCLLYKKNIRQADKLVFPYLLIGGFYLLFWLQVAGPNSNLLDQSKSLGLTLQTYSASLASLILWYVKNLFYPVDVVWMKNIQPIKDHAHIWVLGSGITAAGIIALLYSWRRQPVKIISALWFLMGFALLIPAAVCHSYMGMTIEPHWFYFSSMGFFLLSAILIGELKGKVRIEIWAGMVLSLVLLLGTQTVRYLMAAKTEESYCLYWLRAAPRNPHPMLRLGIIYSNAKMYNKSLYYYDRILKTSRYHPHIIYNNIATIFSENNRLSEAKEYVQLAVQDNPDYAKIYNTLGVIGIKENNLTDAKKAFAKAVELSPFDLPSLLNLADLYLLDQQFERALPLLTRVLHTQPNHPERSNIIKKIRHIKQQGF